MVGEGLVETVDLTAVVNFAVVDVTAYPVAVFVDQLATVVVVVVVVVEKADSRAEF